MADFINSLHPAIICLIVCLSKVLEISIQNLKIMLMVKGQKIRATMLAFLECLIWGLVISSVITTLGNNMFLLFFYCLGYALGLFVGSTLENKIALGTTNIEFIVSEKNTEKIITYLKEKEKGFTIFEGKGSKGKVNMILVVVSRKEAKSLITEIEEICEDDVFEIMSDVSKFTGGYGIKK